MEIVWDPQRLAAVAASFGKIELLAEVDSTNSYLLEKLDHLESGWYFCVAQRHLAGRGRHGEPWATPPGGIALSGACQQMLNFAALRGLSLQVGIEILQRFEGLGYTNLKLKWPNDLVMSVASGMLKKLGGILVETRSLGNSRMGVVIGVGINYAVADQDMRAVGQPWTDLSRQETALPEIHQIAQILVEALAALRFDLQTVIDPHRWSRWDALRDRSVRVCRGSESVEGVAQGISHSGALRVNTATGVRVFDSARVQLQTAE